MTARPLEPGEFVLHRGYRMRFTGGRVGELVKLAYTGADASRPNEWVNESLVDRYPLITSTKEVA